MNRLPSTDNVVYPETDGEPMAETDVHFAWMVRIRDQLDYHFREQRVYVATNLLLYYVAGQPQYAVAPDEFVVLDCDPGHRRVFKTWEEGRVPDFVLEVTSQSTRRRDELEKPDIYQRIGVREYFLYDPTADYLDPPLCGFRRSRANRFEPLQPQLDGSLNAETLQLTLALNNLDLVLRDGRTGEVLPTRAEAALRLLGHEEAARRREEAARRREETARRQAETHIAQLEAELRQLRGE